MTYHDDIRKIIADTNNQAARVLSMQLSAAYLAGWKKSGAHGRVPELQRKAIQELTRVNLGYIQEFNNALGKQLEDAIGNRIALGGNYEDIRKDLIPTIKDMFGESGTVTIDRTGQIRQQIEVLSDGTLRRINKVITQPYSSSVQAYSDLLARTTAHAAMERGRKEGYLQQGVRKLQFVGSADERTRPWHFAVLGKVFDIDSDEAEDIEFLLSEPYCRHRTVPYFEGVNTPQDVFDLRKEEAGLYYNSEDERWAFKNEQILS